MDPIAWFIATLHSISGHDVTAALTGTGPDDKASCVLCRFERDPSTANQQAVIEALKPTS
jgi:hypothetical protein